MYILIALIIGILIGFIRRGSINNILSHPYKKWFLGFVGVLLMILLHYYYLITPAFSQFEQFLPIINFISYLLVLIMLILNLDDIYTIIIALGLTFDFIATFINGGFLPVAEAVLQKMPLYSQLTQSIYTGTNAVYSLLQSGQTLLPFLGIILPIPFFTSFFTSLGTVTGLSVGGTFILFGLIGLVQATMVLKETNKKTSKIMEKTEPKRRTKVQKQNRPEPIIRPHFESKTEELFFEELPLPKNKVDRIFDDDLAESKTKVIHNVKQLQQNVPITNESSDDIIFDQTEDLQKTLESLTQPIGTGVINTEEINKQIAARKKKKTQPKVIEDGFFASEFLKNNQESVITEELFATEEVPTQKVANKEKEVIPRVTPKEETKLEKELSEEISRSNDAIFDLDQFNLFLNSIKDEGIKEELEKKLLDLTRTRNSDINIEEVIEEITNPITIDETDIKESSIIDTTGDIEFTTNFTQSEFNKESEEVLSEPEEIVLNTPQHEPSIKEAKTSLEEKIEQYNKLKKELTVELEIVNTDLLDSLNKNNSELELNTKEEIKTETMKPETSTNINENEETAEINDKLIDIEFDSIPDEEVEAEKAQEPIQEPSPETITEVEEAVEVKPEETPVVETAKSTQTEEINLTSLEKLLDNEKKEPKRGTFIQDEGSGYIVNKAYKDEKVKASMDTSEEEMMDIWSQVSKENLERKLGRRRQAAANYQTSNPYQEELQRSKQRVLEQQRELERQEQARLQQEKEALNKHMDNTAQQVKSVTKEELEQMTDEERRAAGYELVSLEVMGQTLSFWQKINK